MLALLKLFRLFSILVLSACIIQKSQSVIYPRIEIKSWITTFEDPSEKVRMNNIHGAHNWAWESENLTNLLQTGLLTVSRQDEYLTYVVSQHIERLRISCTAPYPITWVSPQDPIHQDPMFSYVFSVSDKRLAKNVRDPATFSYVSTLDLYDSSGMATRNYTCRSLQNNPYVERHLYIYWEGSTYLVYAGEVLDIRSQDGETIVLPCKVTKPDVAAFLYKETSKGYEEVALNSSIAFNPVYGFTLKLNELADPYGRYECVSEDDSDSDELDSLRLNVLRGIQKDTISSITFNQTIQPGSKIKFDVKKQKIFCCSNSQKPPNFRVIYCRNELSCLMKEHLLHKISSKSPKSDINGSCTTYDVYARESGILRCRGDGIDVFHKYFTGVQHLNNRTVQLYFTRNQAKPEDLIEVTASIEDYHLYSGQNFTAFCETSNFYFIKGLQWAIIWKNNSIQFLQENLYNPTLTEEIRNEPYQDFDTVEITADYDMYSLICFAPIWNSTNLWAKKELVLDVQESVMPSLLMEESVTWELNDTNKQIECQVEGGRPEPFVRWRKNNKSSIMHDQNIFINSINDTSIVKFHVVKLDTQGNYTCIAINYAGSVEKTITVYVEAGSNEDEYESEDSSASGIFTFFITSVMSALILGIGILIWKLQIQKQIINHLSGVVFRDISREESNQTTTGTNNNASSEGIEIETQQQQFPAFQRA